MLSATDLTAPSPIWNFQDVDQANLIAGVSCPSSAPVRGGGQRGGYADLNRPYGTHTSWNITLVDERAGFASVSCPSSTLCVAGDTNGDVEVSTDPSSSTPVWKLVAVDRASRQRFSLDNLTVACTPSATMCAAGDFAGRMMVSTDPAAAEPDWSVKTVDRAAGQPRSITSLSCPSVSLCVAGDSAGNILIGRPRGSKSR